MSNIRFLQVFGAIDSDAEIGFPVNVGGAELGSVENILMPYLTALSNFREEIRTLARNHKGGHFVDLNNSGGLF